MSESVPRSQSTGNDAVCPAVTVIVWFFLGLVFFQYVPVTTFSRPIERVWLATVENPWMKLSHRIRFGLGWLALLGLVFGSAFGFSLADGSTYGQRTQGVFGLFAFQLLFFIFSAHHKAIQWRTVIVGLAFQQILAMFVLKSGAGFAIFVSCICPSDLAFTNLTHFLVELDRDPCIGLFDPGILWVCVLLQYRHRLQAVLVLFQYPRSHYLLHRIRCKSI